MSTDTKYWVAFNNIPGIGRVRLSLLEQHFGSLRDAWEAPLSELRKAGLDPAAMRTITKWRETISPDDEVQKLARAGVRILTSNEDTYPARLKEIYDYPPVLYVRGELRPEDEYAVAVVGTRRTTVYGKQVTGELAAELANSGITVVSGLARGVDTVAHRAALEAGGRTIAVFACGLDLIYPPENERLAREITGRGACISEYPLGTRPRAENFPRRNRILSGLSLGVLITEASEDSGAMITARFAVEQNREVFAVPGSVLSPASRGTNRLIQDGAKLVRQASDIMEELNLTTATRQMEMRELLPETDIEAVLLRELGPEPRHIDEVCRRSGLPVAEVSGTLAMMELKGLVKQVGAMNYVLARELRQDYYVKVE